MNGEGYSPQELRKVPDFILSNLLPAICKSRDRELDGLCQEVQEGTSHPLAINQFQSIYEKIQAELHTLVGELRQLIEDEFKNVDDLVLTADAVAQLSTMTASFALSKHVDDVADKLAFLGIELGDGDFVPNMRNIIMQALCSSQAPALDPSAVKGIC